MLHFQKTFFRCSSRRFSTSKCFSGLFRRSTLMGDFLRYGRKKVEILKKMSMLETGIKAKKKKLFLQHVFMYVLLNILTMC